MSDIVFLVYADAGLANKADELKKAIEDCRIDISKYTNLAEEEPKRSVARRGYLDKVSTAQRAKEEYMAQFPKPMIDSGKMFSYLMDNIRQMAAECSKELEYARRNAGETCNLSTFIGDSESAIRAEAGLRFFNELINDLRDYDVRTVSRFVKFATEAIDRVTQGMLDGNWMPSSTCPLRNAVKLYSNQGVASAAKKIQHELDYVKRLEDKYSYTSTP